MSSTAALESHPLGQIFKYGYTCTMLSSIKYLIGHNFLPVPALVQGPVLGGETCTYTPTHKKNLCVILNEDQVKPYLNSKTWFFNRKNNAIKGAGDSAIFLTYTNRDSVHDEYVRGFECFGSDMNFLLRTSDISGDDKLLAIIEDKQMLERDPEMPELIDAD